MMSLDKERTFFVENIKEYLENNLNLEKKICGVSIAPIHIYTGENDYLLGKACIVLGKERDGIYRDKFNFFGGKVEDKSGCQNEIDCIATTIFEEAFEEMGYILDAKNFEKSIVKIIQTDFNRGSSVIFVCHITGISRNKWLHIMSERLKDKYLEWKYQEMSEIEHIAIEDIQLRKDISIYVKQNMYNFLPLFKLLNRYNNVYIGNFKH
jgi:hypothetical protein